MGLRTQQLKGLNGGLNAVAQDLEGLEGPTQSPDLLNCYGLPGTVFSRLGSAPWWDTGGTGPLYWFSFFKRFDMDDDNTGGTDLNDHQDDVRVDGATIDGTGWHWPSVPGSPPARPRQNSYSFRILTPAAYALGIDPAATLHITWQRRRLALGYKIQVKDADTGSEVLSYPDCPTTGYTVPAGTFARSKSYTIKVWAIMARTVQGAPTQLVPADNTRTFNTLLTVPINLAPTGTLTTLTPTMTCDAVVKAVRYKVKIYDAAGTTLLHTSMALLLPSYPLGAGVLSAGTSYKWTFTAYADSVCTAAYGVESAQAALDVVYPEYTWKLEFPASPTGFTASGQISGQWVLTGATSPIIAQDADFVVVGDKHKYSVPVTITWVSGTHPSPDVYATTLDFFWKGPYNSNGQSVWDYSLELPSPYVLFAYIAARGGGFAPVGWIQEGGGHSSPVGKITRLA
jgi:hypothetical protein